MNISSILKFTVINNLVMNIFGLTQLRTLFRTVLCFMTGNESPAGGGKSCRLSAGGWTGHPGGLPEMGFTEVTILAWPSFFPLCAHWTVVVSDYIELTSWSQKSSKNPRASHPHLCFTPFGHVAAAPTAPSTTVGPVGPESPACSPALSYQRGEAGS